MMEPVNACRLCKSMKQVEKDLKNSEFTDLFLLITKTKIEDTIFSMICTECHIYLDSFSEFFQKCNESNEYFKNIEKKLQSEPTVFPVSFVSVKVEKEEPLEDSFYDDAPPSPRIEVIEKAGNKSTTENKPKKGQARYICDLCNQDVRGRRELLRHMKENHLTSAKTCLICMEGFINIGELKKHRKKVHPSITKAENAEKKVPCHICGNLYTRHFIHYHVLTHSEIREFKCNKCPAAFPLMRALTFHEKRVHIDGRPFSCEVCGKSYKKKRDLTEHCFIHDANWKAFECEQCNIKFNHKASYRRHLRLHSGRKNYQCDSCEKTFACQQGLKQHSWSHSGFRPHNCDVCKKGFYTKKAANEHKHQMHG